MDGAVSTPDNIYPIVFLIIFVVAAMGIPWLFMNSRSRSLSSLAASLKLHFKKVGPYGHEAFHETRLKAVNPGNGAKLINLIEYRAEGTLPDITFFDSRQTGQRGHYYFYSVALVDLKTPRLPKFDLYIEDFGQKVCKLVSTPDELIELRSTPDFFKKYALTGPDKAAVESFFSAGAIKCLEGRGPWAIQSSGRYLAIYNNEKFVSVSNYQEYMDEIYSLVSDLLLLPGTRKAA